MTLLLVTNGLLAKRGLRQARKHEVAERLAAAARSSQATAPAPPTALATDAPGALESASAGGRR